MGTRERMVMTAMVAVLLLALLPTASAVSYDSPQATVYTIELNEEGDATWTVELRYQLIGDDDVDAFKGIIRDFESGNLTTFEGIEEEMRPLAEEASEKTGRPMSVSGFQRDAYIEESPIRTVGIVSVNFTWTNFANVTNDGEVVRLGDVFVGSGLALTQNERLVVRYIDGYEPVSVSPEADVDDGERLIWDGKRFFEEGNPEVVFSSSPEEFGGDDGGAVGDNGGDTGSGSASATVGAVLAGIVVLLSGFAGGIYLGRRTGFLQKDDDEGGTVVTPTDGAETVATPSDDGDEGTEEDGTPIDDELLTDEDRIVRLLDRRGGRMKQAEIVEETDWSKSKVSMLLSDMEEEGTISKLRLGRENVIDLEEGNGEAEG